MYFVQPKLKLFMLLKT